MVINRFGTNLARDVIRNGRHAKIPADSRAHFQ
jgi:hypothetical protein